MRFGLDMEPLSVFVALSLSQVIVLLADLLAGAVLLQAAAGFLQNLHASFHTCLPLDAVRGWPCPLLTYH